MSDDSFAALFEAQAAGDAQRAHKKLRIGDMLQGIVLQIDKDTIFVEVDAKRQAMLDVELMRTADGTLPIKVGDTIHARVASIDPETQAVQLEQPRPTTEEAGAAAAPFAPRATFEIGAIVSGRVVRVESYGVFLQLGGSEGREGRGLIPLAELDVARGVDLRKTFPDGTVLTAKVIENAAGRLKLSVRGAREAKERAEFEAHKEKAAAPESLGTFGDLLKKRAK